jgi:ParB family transcriptional regulator, chromosome partitioning protein
VSAKKGLGRGFSSLIPTELLDETFDPTAAQDEKVSELRELPLSKVEPNPDQPRRTFDELALEEMAASIKQHGVVQPIVVTPHGSGYRIVAGERRYRASQKAGVKTIPALVRSMGDQLQLEVSLIENIQRRDLNVLETATAYLKLKDQFNLTLDEIGARVGGKSVSAISNTLRLLRLPESVKKALHDGALREGQARPLIGLDEEVIDAVLPQILQEEWSARKIEQFIVDLKKKQQDATVKERIVSPQHEAAIEGLTSRLGAKVQIRSNTRGAGQIVIAFANEEEFDRISKLLG